MRTVLTASFNPRSRSPSVPGVHGQQSNRWWFGRDEAALGAKVLMCDQDGYVAIAVTVAKDG